MSTRGQKQPPLPDTRIRCLPSRPLSRLHHNTLAPLATHSSLACLLHDLEHLDAEDRWGVDHVETGSGHGRDLVFGAALSARDDGTGVAHTPARGGRAAGDEADDWLAGVTVLRPPFGGVLLGGSTDLTDHDDALRLRVVAELLEAVDEVAAVEGVTADAHNSGLAKARGGGLVHSLVREGAGARDDTDLSLGVDVAGHDADLALSGLDDAGAVRANELGGGLLAEGPLDLGHVLLGNALRDAHRERDLRLDGVHDGSRSEGWRDVDGRGVRASLGHGLGHGVEHGQVDVRLPALAGRHATHHVGAVLDGLLRVERTLLAREALADHLGVLVDPHLGCGTQARPLGGQHAAGSGGKHASALARRGWVKGGGEGVEGGGR